MLTFKIKSNKKIKASDNEIYTSLSNQYISIDKNVLQQYILKDDDPLDNLIDFDATDSYIKWKFTFVDNGIGQARLGITITDLVLKGKVKYEVDDGEYGSPVEVDNVQLPVNNDKINVSTYINSNLIGITSFTYNEDGSIDIDFGSVDE